MHHAVVSGDSANHDGSGSETTVFPWILAIVVAAIAAVGFAQERTSLWPFSSVGYIDMKWALGTIVFCLCGILFGFRLQRALRDIKARYVEMACMVFASLVFVSYLMNAGVQYPFLEGDGVLDSAHPRLREHYVKFLTGWMNLDGSREPIYDGARVQVSNPRTLQAAWEILGVLFLILSVWGILKSCERAKDRHLLLALCLSLPTSATFLQYYDNYSLNYVLVVLASFLFLVAVRKRSLVATGLSVVALAVNCLAHPLSIVFVVYPILWAICAYVLNNNVNRSLRVRVIMSGFGVVIVLTVLFAIYFSCVGLRKPLGFFPSNVVGNDGWCAAIGHPILLPLSFLITYVVLCVATLFSHRTVFPFLDGPRQAIEASLFYGSQMIFWSYCLLQFLAAKANFGMLDFMSQCGAMGGLFVVPSVVLAWQVSIRKHLLSLVVFNLFVLLPTVLVHKSENQLKRVMDYMPRERGYYYADVSPYVHVGLRLARNGTESLCLESFRRGVRDGGFYRSQNVLNFVFYLAWAFEFRNDEECRGALEYAIHTNPNVVVDLWRNGTRFTNRYQNKAYRRIRDASRDILIRDVQMGNERGYHKQLLSILGELENKNL